MIASDSGSSYTPCPPGSYLAKLCRMVDNGTCANDFQGEIKHARKVTLSFEILDDQTRRDDGEPFVLSKRYTLSLHEKAALRKDLASWRGRDFTPAELKGFDLKTILGHTCFLSVVESAKGDRVYSNVASIMKTPRGMPVPAGTEPVLYWDMNGKSPDWQSFVQLHPKLQAQIETSPEFARLTPPASVTLASKPPVSAQQRPALPTAPQPTKNAPVGSVASGFDDIDDDIPF